VLSPYVVKIGHQLTWTISMPHSLNEPKKKNTDLVLRSSTSFSLIESHSKVLTNEVVSNKTDYLGMGLMLPEQRSWWKIALELKLRKSNGDSFQDFFSTVMGKLHGDDFVKIRAFGSLGDYGCDGYLQSSGQVFQCYGALNGDSGKVDYLISKMRTDFDKAAKKLPSIMKEWHMVHNLVDGLPVQAILQLETLRKDNPSIKFGFIGLEGFEQRIFGMPQDNIETLLGVVANNLDTQNLQTVELRELIKSVSEEADSIKFDVSAIRPVPADKLDLNELPSHWRFLIAGGWQNAHLVEDYFSRHPNPLTGEIVAQFFHNRYKYLREQNLLPGMIMSSLYETVTGQGSVSPARQVAGQALLAYLFESCDIFEDVRKVVR
jgi:hypothetical protein